LGARRAFVACRAGAARTFTAARGDESLRADASEPRAQRVVDKMMFGVHCTSRRHVDVACLHQELGV
jgi:hypothetical protein